MYNLYKKYKGGILISDSYIKQLKQIRRLKSNESKYKSELSLIELALNYHSDKKRFLNKKKFRRKGLNLDEMLFCLFRKSLPSLRFYGIFKFFGLQNIYFYSINRIEFFIIFFKNSCRKLFKLKKRYSCPCCGASFADFNDFYFFRPCYSPRMYLKHHKKTICPVCSSLPRHRILMQFLLSNLEMITNKKILVFGLDCGESAIFKKLNIRYYSADLQKEADFNYDIQNIACSDESYDVIICNHILEHVEDYKKSIKELHRILKYGGYLFISVPTDTKNSDTKENIDTDNMIIRKILFGQIDHLRVFGKNFPDYLNEANFNVVCIKGDSMPDTIKPVTGPAFYDHNVIYLCQKK